MNFIFSGILFIFLFSRTLTTKVTLQNVHYLQQGDLYYHEPGKSRIREFHIFCYPGKPKSVVYVWQSVFLHIKHSTDDYTRYDGATPEMVHQEYQEKKESWSFSLFSTAKQKNIKLDPFNSSCIGIESKDAYQVRLNVIRIDLWKLLSLVAGILLFLSGEKLSKNTVFHYICGVTFGICASFLILIYFLSKLFPRKPLMYGVIGCGWTIVVYFLQILWENLQTVLMSYKSHIVWYTVVTGLVSFVLCYRWGPVKNERTKNLIKWSLQLAGLVLMFFSSNYQEAAMGQIVILLFTYYLPQKWLRVPKTYWKRKFPPKRKLISHDEFEEQGIRETTKALDELRKYCSSPECNQWKTALKLKDVKRFASFVEGNSHLSDEEILEYETSLHGDLTDDEYNGEYSEDDENLENNDISEDEGGY